MTKLGSNGQTFAYNVSSSSWPSISFPDNVFAFADTANSDGVLFYIRQKGPLKFDIGCYYPGIDNPPFTNNCLSDEYLIAQIVSSYSDISLVLKGDKLFLLATDALPNIFVWDVRNMSNIKVMPVLASGIPKDPSQVFVLPDRKFMILDNREYLVRKIPYGYIYNSSLSDLPISVDFRNTSGIIGDLNVRLLKPKESVQY